MTQTTQSSGREQYSETVQMKLALRRDCDAVDWETGVPGTDYTLVKLNGDASMDDVTQLHKIAAEFGRTVSLYEEVEHSGATKWKLEARQ